MMRVAIVHEWLTTYAGSERVLEQMLLCYPDADLFCLFDFLPTGERDFIQNKQTSTSFIQNLPFAKKRYQYYLPLMPLAIEQFDLSDYDLVLSSSHAVAKGVITGPDQLHISYVHSPMRYAWDLQHQYLRQSALERGLVSWVVRQQLHKIRIWDIRTANGVNRFIANSNYIARRIWKAYRREATVVHPPVDTDKFKPAGNKEDFYLTASRLVPYKRVDIIVDAFSHMPDLQLIVIGDGPNMPEIKAKAGHNVSILGYQPYESLLDHLQRARAFVFAANEDFGIVPLEAQACGTPVIAFGKGGAVETIRGLWPEPHAIPEEPTGVFFTTQSAQAIMEAVDRFESSQNLFSSDACRNNAVGFSPERFRHEFKSIVEVTWRDFFEKLR